MFAVLHEAGFSWTTANTKEPTCRTRPDGTPEPPFTRIDWFFTRGFDADDAATLPAMLLGDVAGKRVLDLCAAPGGKTMQLAARGAQVHRDWPSVS